MVRVGFCGSYSIEVEKPFANANAIPTDGNDALHHELVAVWLIQHDDVPSLQRPLTDEGPPEERCSDQTDKDMLPRSQCWAHELRRDGR